MGETGVGRSPALPAEPPAQDILCTIPMGSNIEELKRKARKRAKRVFKMHNLTRLILEREYMAERRAILEKVSPGISIHEGKGYDLADPTYQRIPELEALNRKYREHIRRYKAVEDVLAELAKTDPEAKQLVEVCYIEPGIGRSRSVAWVVTHADMLGVYLSERTASRKLAKAATLLAQRMGWLPPVIC